MHKILQEVAQSKKDYDAFTLQKKIKKYYINQEHCRQIAYNILNMADFTYNFRNSNNTIIDRKILQVWLKRFVAGDRFLEGHDASNTVSNENNSSKLREQQLGWIVNCKVTD